MKKFDPKNTPTPVLHQLIVGAVAPRPIAFVSTMDEEGNPNLAPYSFFNAFSSNPPTLVFSSNRKVADNTTKDTLHNAEATREVVVNVVAYDMVHQMALSSVSYPPEVNEFEKAGFTPIASEKVKPFRVAESPVQFECTVKEIISLGEEGGAGNLILCEVQLIHVAESAFTADDKLDPALLDLVGRMGRTYYTRAKGDLFSIYRPVNQIGIGYDALPDFILKNKDLSAAELSELAAVEQMPEPSPVDGDYSSVIQTSKALIAERKSAEALAILLTLA